MIFTDLWFCALVTITWAAFFTVPHGRRSAVLCLSGVVFYAWYAGPALLLVGSIVAVTFLFGRGRTASVVVTGLITLLAAVKFSAPSTGQMLPTSAGVFVPLGLSFLIFELIHVAVERRRGRLAELFATDFAAYAMFFPCRMAGPIRRYPQFIDAVASASPSAENGYRGAWRIVVGLAKKRLLAEPLGIAVTLLPVAATTVEAWRGLIACSLWIYIDFSAYSDIAIGVARLFGIDVPENFRWPYLSVNVKQFWERWHISLSQWIRDYVFLPLGQALFHTRLRAWPWLLAVVTFETTFLVVGAWHGLAINFLVWGGYHGLLLAGHHLYTRWVPAWLTEWPPYRSPLASAASGALTFALVTVGWLPFALDLQQSARLFRLLVGAHS